MISQVKNSRLPSFGEVRVHFLRLCPALKEDMGILSAAEFERANGYSNAVSRDRFISARAALRKILAACLGQEAGQISIRTEPHGKPRVEGISFSISHSADSLLIALTTAGEVGVDVERHRPRPVDPLARRFFSKGEVAQLDQATEQEREALFHTIWTRKEAWLKGLGYGLVFPLSDWDVSDVNKDKPAVKNGWRVYDLNVGENLSAAVATNFQASAITMIRSSEESELL